MSDEEFWRWFHAVYPPLAGYNQQGWDSKKVITLASFEFVKLLKEAYEAGHDQRGWDSADDNA